MLRWLACCTCLLAGLLWLSAGHARAQQRIPSPLPPDTAHLAAAPTPPAVQVTSGSCLSTAYSVVLPISAVTLFALPVAGVAALVAHRRTDAVAGALVGGTLYAGGATVAVASNCAPRAIYTYLGTPFAATLGALVGGVWRR